MLFASASFAPFSFSLFFFSKAEVNEPACGWREMKIRSRGGEARWQANKRLTRDQMDRLRALHTDNPELWTITKLSASFKVGVTGALFVHKKKINKY